MSSLTRPNRASNTAQQCPVNKRNNFSIKSLKFEYNYRFNAILYFHLYTKVPDFSIVSYFTLTLNMTLFYLCLWIHVRFSLPVIVSFGAHTSTKTSLYLIQWNTSSSPWHGGKVLHIFFFALTENSSASSYGQLSTFSRRDVFWHIST